MSGVGGHRAAELLAGRVGAKVTKDIVERLADAGHLTEVGWWRGWPLWDPDHLDAINPQVVLDTMETSSVVTTPEAIERLGIRPVDFEHLARAEAITPTKVVTTRYGTPARLWLVADLDLLAGRDDLDWSTLRQMGPGECSGLARLTPPRSRRARVIRRAVNRLAAELGVEVWCRWDQDQRCWEIDTDPASPEITDAITTHPDLAAWAEVITVGTPAGAATGWARAMLDPGRAVVIDVETTDLDGLIVEIAAVDAATGEVLVDTLINPGELIAPEAQAVHGITDNDIDRAPELADILPGLLNATRGRTVIAYNASFDLGRLLAHCDRDGLDPAHLANPDRWDCAMQRWSDWLDLPYRVALNGGHRALSDCLAVRDLLTTMTTHPARTRR